MLTPAQLNGTRLSWRIIISALDPKPGETYFAQVVVTQGGQPVENGVHTYAGPLFDVKPIVDSKRITLSAP